MSVYKELKSLKREIQKRSERIYSDACDFGVVIEDFNDPLIKLVKSLMALYRVKPTTHKYSTGATQTYRMNGGLGMYIEAGFEEMTIEYVTASSPKRPLMKGYLYIYTTSSKKVMWEALPYLN